MSSSKEIPQHHYGFLLEKFIEADTYEKVPTFECANRIIIFKYKDDNDRTMCNPLLLKESHQQFVSVSKQVPYDESPICRIINNSQDLLLTIEELVQWLPEIQPYFPNSKRIRVIPCSFLSCPLIYILIPEEEITFSISYYERHYTMTSGLISKCMMKDLWSQFSLKQLNSIESSTELVRHFVQILSSWMMPVEYSIYLKGKLLTQKKYCKEYHNSKQNFTLYLKVFDKRYEVVFGLPSYHLTTGRGERRYIHDSESFHWRRLQYQRYFLDYFEQIHQNWASLIEIKNQVRDEVIEEYEKTTEQLKNQNNDDPKTNPQSYGVDGFVFRRKDDVWEVISNKIERRFKVTSPTGMESIRILLSQPNTYFEPLELSELLTLNGFGYKRKQQLKSNDPELDRINYLDLVDTINGFKKIEVQIRSASLTDQYRYWKNRKDVVNSLITHKKSVQWLIEYRTANINLKKVASLMEDDNFDLLGNGNNVYSANKKSGDEKNRKDTAIKNIKKAIDAIRTQDSELADYFTATLILKNTKGFKPFIFLPDENKNRHFKNIIWQTE